MLCHKFIGQISNFNTIYLFSETWRGYREAEVSDGSFKQLLNLEFLFDLIIFQCLLEAPECCTEKLSSTTKCRCLMLKIILQ